MKKSEGFAGEIIIEIPRSVQHQCAKLPLIKALYITRVGFYPRALHHYYQRPSGRSEVVLIYCIDGLGWIQWNSERIEVQAGNIVIIPATIAHSYGADQKNPWTIYWFHIKGDAHDQITRAFELNTLRVTKQVSISLERNKLFNQIIQTFLKGYSTTNLLFANLSLGYYLSTFIAPEYLKNELAVAPPEDAVELAVRFLQQNIGKTLSLQAIAHSAHLSVSFFSRKFKIKTGYSPIEYFNHLKIQKACQLLHFSDLRINEVAMQIGIPDPFYFSRVFKKNIGVSPANYKKNGRN